MPAFIYLKTYSPDLTTSDVVFWNRRKKQWEPDLTESCIYPTFKGTKRTANKLFRENSHAMKPHYDIMGQMDLDSFARDGYDKRFLG